MLVANFLASEITAALYAAEWENVGIRQAACRIPGNLWTRVPDVKAQVPPADTTSPFFIVSGCVRIFAGAKLPKPLKWPIFELVSLGKVTNSRLFPHDKSTPCGGR